MDENVNLRYVIFLAATAALGGLLFGFDIATITGAGPFLLEHFKLTELSLGWAFSCLLFGCVVGSVFAGRLADRYGRKRVLLAVSVMFAATSAATGLASTFTNFVAARFLGGLAVGAASLISPMYVSEVSPPRHRDGWDFCTSCRLSQVFWFHTALTICCAIPDLTTGVGCF